MNKDRDFYQLAVLLADALSRHHPDRQLSFINHLARICSDFANSNTIIDLIKENSIRK